jgi:hypothetical protein
LRIKLQDMQSQYLLDLAEVIVATNDEKGKIRVHYAGNLSFGQALQGPFDETPSLLAAFTSRFPIRHRLIAHSRFNYPFYYPLTNGIKKVSPSDFGQYALKCGSRLY